MSLLEAAAQEEWRWFRDHCGRVVAGVLATLCYTDDWRHSPTLMMASRENTDEERREFLRC